MLSSKGNRGGTGPGTKYFALHIVETEFHCHTHATGLGNRGGVNMVGDLVFFLLGAWVGACFAVLVLSLLAGASETAPPSRFDRIEIDRVSDCV